MVRKIKDRWGEYEIDRLNNHICYCELCRRFFYSENVYDSICPKCCDIQVIQDE